MFYTMHQVSLQLPKDKILNQILENAKKHFSSIWFISYQLQKNWNTRILSSAELEFLNSLWGLGTEEGYRTGPPGYIG